MKDDHYRLIGIYLLIAIGIIIWAISGIVRSCDWKGTTEEQRDTVIVVTTDTVTMVVTDTVPEVRKEVVVKYVKTPVFIRDSTETDSVAIVQREYSDDSTYTAYVSGVSYEEWPKLDSIMVKRQEVTKTIHEVVTITEREKAPRLGVGVQVGYGYGMLSNRFEPYVGVGIHYRLW